jgi:hypothetical protein
MINYEYITDESIFGEPPPVLFIQGTTFDFYQLVCSLICFIKEKNITRTNKNINVNTEYQLELDNKINTGIIINRESKTIKISFDTTNWIDIIIALVNLAIKPVTVYLEPSQYFSFEWTTKLEYLIILESHN